MFHKERKFEESEIRPVSFQNKMREKSLIFNFLLDVEIGDLGIWNEALGKEVKRVASKLTDRGYDMDLNVTECFKNYYGLFNQNIGDAVRRNLIELLIAMGHELGEYSLHGNNQADIFIKLDKLMFLNNHLPKPQKDKRTQILGGYIAEILNVGATIDTSV